MTYTVYFDLETGGVEPQHPTIQLSALAVEDGWYGREVANFDTKIRFDVGTADPKALEINHYTLEAWQGAPSPATAARNFAEWLQPYCSVRLISKRTGNPYHVAKLAGFNALIFDFPRLKAMFGAEFFPCSYQVRDVLQRALFYFDDWSMEAQPENFKLVTLCEYFKIPTQGAHDALTDCRLTVALHTALRGMMPEI